MKASEPTKLVRPYEQARATVTVAVGVDEAFRIFAQGSMCGGGAGRVFAMLVVMRAIRTSFALSRMLTDACLSRTY